jgi:hypothetical protein
MRKTHHRETNRVFYHHALFSKFRTFCTFETVKIVCEDSVTEVSQRVSDHKDHNRISVVG